MASGQGFIVSNITTPRTSGDSADSGVYIEEIKGSLDDYVATKNLNNVETLRVISMTSSEQQLNLSQRTRIEREKASSLRLRSKKEKCDVILKEDKILPLPKSGTETQALMSYETQAVEGSGRLLLPVETEARRLIYPKNEVGAISPKPSIIRSTTMQAAHATSPEVILQEARKCQSNGLWQGSIQLLSLSKVVEDPIYGGYAAHLMAEAYHEMGEHQTAWEFGRDALKALEQRNNDKDSESMKRLYDCTALMARLAWVLDKCDQANVYRTRTVNGYKSVLAMEQRKRDEENRRRIEAFSKVTDLVQPFGLRQRGGTPVQDNGYIQLEGDDKKILEVFARSVKARNYELADAMMLDKSILCRRCETKFDDTVYWQEVSPTPLSGTALHYAIEHNSLRCVAILLAMGADINDEKSVMPPLSAAIQFEREDLALLLLENGADPNGTSNTIAKKPLDCALELNNIKIAEVLLQGGTDTNRVMIQSMKHTFDILISIANNLEAVSLLLKHGADPNHVDPTTRRTPLYSATMHKQTEIAKVLLLNGATPSTHFAGNKLDTPLHAAARNNDTTMAKLLCDAGADVNYRNGIKETPFFIAVQLGHVHFATFLRKRGADIKLANKGNETPLHVATETARIQTVTMLCQEGADTNAVRDVYRETPLHIAAREGYLEISAVLCGYDANVNARAENGWTPLHKATWYGNLEVVDRLCKEGADVNAKTDSQQTPLDLAKKEGNFDIMKLLYKNGGRYNSTWRLRRNYRELSKAIKKRH